MLGVDSDREPGRPLNAAIRKVEANTCFLTPTVRSRGSKLLSVFSRRLRQGYFTLTGEEQNERTTRYAATRLDFD